MASSSRLFKTAIALITKKDAEEAITLRRGELDYVKAQLDALAKKDLLSSITLFKEGLTHLYQLFEKEPIPGNDKGDGCRAVALCGKQGEMCVKLFQDFQDRTFDKEDKWLLKSKGNFEQARFKAIDAFNTENLLTSHRIQAMVIRLGATILKDLDHPEGALVGCLQCLEDLASLKDVQESFNLGLHPKFYRPALSPEGKEIISSVCLIYRAVYDVALAVGKRGELLTLPLIDTGKEKVHPLHDSKVAQILHGQKQQQISMTPRSLGQTKEEDYLVKVPQGVAANLKDYIFVGDEWDCNVKVFHTMFQNCLPLAFDVNDANESIADVATDHNENVYVLVETQAEWEKYSYKICVFGQDKRKSDGFLLKKESKQVLKMTVNGDNDVLVLTESLVEPYANTVDSYKSSGDFNRTFGDGHIKCGQDICAIDDGRVVVLDIDGESFLSIHTFSRDGEHLDSFKLKEFKQSLPRVRYSIGSCPVSDQVVLAVPNVIDSRDAKTSVVSIVVYDINDGTLVRNIRDLSTESLCSTRGIAVTQQGSVILGLLDKHEGNSKVLAV